MTLDRIILAVTEPARPSLLVPTNSFSLPSLSNPASSADAVNRLAFALVNFTLGISATFAVMGMMYGGFLMILGGDNVATGRKAMFVSLGGLAGVAVAYTAVSLVIGQNPLQPDLGIRA